MVKETQSETEERLKEERAIEIVDRLRDGYKKMFRDSISDEEITKQIDLKIEDAKVKFIQHMLHNLCGTVLEPEDLFRAKKMIVARNMPTPEPVIPVVVAQPIKPQQEEAIVRQRGRPRAK